MHIIKTFLLSDFPHLEIYQSGKFSWDWFKLKGFPLGVIRLPPVNPLWVHHYFGLQLHEPQGCKVAMKRYPEDGYRSFDGTTWIDSLEPTYQPVEEIHPGLPTWEGGYQLEIELDATANLKEITVGYDVQMDLLDYILDFTLQQAIEQPVRLSKIINSCQGNTIEAPKLFNLAKVTNIEVQRPGQLPVQGILNGKYIEIPIELDHESVRVYFDCIPKADYPTDDIYQITELPCVVIRLGLPGKTSKPIRYDFVYADNSTQYESLLYSRDETILVEVIAQDPGDGKAIADQLMDRFNQSGGLYVPAFDINVPMYVKQGITNKGGDKVQESGTLLTWQFELLLKNFSVTTNAKPPIAEEYLQNTHKL